MKNDDYKVLKTPEEMTKEEKAENNVSDYVEDGTGDSFSVYTFLYSLGAVIGYAFFTILFGLAGLGGLGLFGKVDNSTTRVICLVFGLFSILIGYKCVQATKEMIKMFKKRDKNKPFVITIGNIGYALITIPISLLIICVFVSIFTNNELAIKFLNNSPLILMVCGLLGAILIYVDVGLDMAHKNNVIIGKKK